MFSVPEGRAANQLLAATTFKPPMGAVREVLLAPAVIHEDGSRDDRRERHAVVALDDGLHPVSRQNLKRGALGRPGQRVRVLAHVHVPMCM
jgi:hypothetical protein